MCRYLSGECPDPVGRYDNSNQANGIPQSGTFTAQTCKQQCIANSDCAAVDFNRLTSGCFFHEAFISEHFNEDNPCCIHFRKTFCT